MAVRKLAKPGAALLLIFTAVLLFSGSGRLGTGEPVSGGTASVKDEFRQIESVINESGDLDGDGIKEEYTLENHILSVKIGGREIWKSPGDYRIDSFALDDIDNDGIPNLVFSLWKTGSFGKMKPFWHTGEDTEYKNHLFVYKLKDNTLKPVWCSSSLDRPILSFTISDINNDGRNELIVKEGSYKKIIGDRYAADPKGEERTTVWKWEEWGFQLCDMPDYQ